MMIYVECTPDRKLILFLGFQGNDVISSCNKGTVCTSLKNKTNCIGLVDEDPESCQPLYLKQLKLVKMKNGIKLLKDEHANNYLIILCPRLEGWILKAARKSRVDVTKYGFSGDEMEFHKYVNLRLDDFRNLLHELHHKSSMLKTLKEFLKGSLEVQWKCSI